MKSLISSGVVGEKMNSIDDAISNALKINMGFKPGESVGIVMQEWAPHLGESTKQAFERSRDLCNTMLQVYQSEGVDIVLLKYTPNEARNGADATQDLYEAIGTKDIIFMPTVFSLTHTPFAIYQTGKGSRIASMPGFTLEMFDEDGPMNADYEQLDKDTRQIADKLRESDYVRVTGENTYIIVQIDRNLVHASTGMLTQRGKKGNLPGAEAYAVPVHEGKSNGYITIPAGWGGEKPLLYKVTFQIANGRFTDAIGDSAEAQKYIDREVKPSIFGQPNFDVLAELGIGTNPKITADYITRRGWSTLVAEKIIKTAHFANGNSKSMGGQNDVRVHNDWVVPNVRTEFNYQP